jgi:hypothetical protein
VNELPRLIPNLEMSIWWPRVQFTGWGEGGREGRNLKIGHFLVFFKMKLEDKFGGTQEAEAECQIQGQPGLNSETLRKWAKLEVWLKCCKCKALSSNPSIAKKERLRQEDLSSRPAWGT